RPPHRKPRPHRHPPPLPAPDPGRPPGPSRAPPGGLPSFRRERRPPRMSYRKKLTSPEDAVGLIRSGMRVFVSGNAATPTPLLKALAARKDELENVELVHLLQTGEDPFAAP